MLQAGVINDVDKPERTQQCHDVFKSGFRENVDTAAFNCFTNCKSEKNNLPFGTLALVISLRSEYY